MAATGFPSYCRQTVGNEVETSWAIVYLLTATRFDVKG